MTGKASLPVVWDILEEHLDEAAWLWDVWEAALDSALYVIADVANGPEERLRAHLDGLVLGGRRVAEKMLLPALLSGKRAHTAVAAWSLVQAEDADYQDAVFRLLGTAKPMVRAALARALALSDRADLSRLVPLWHSATAPLQAIVLEVFGSREPDWLRERIAPALRSDDPALVAAGLKAIRIFPDAAFLDAVKDALNSSDPSVCQEAVLAGITLSSKTAWTVCRRLAVDGDGEWCRVPLGLLALSPDPKDRDLLRARARAPEHRRHALWALGFAGDLETADLLLEAMADEETAPLAGEAFSTITGVVISGQLAEAGETKGPTLPEVADAEPPPDVRSEDSLPAPLPAQVKAWWNQARPHFRADTRYLFGLPRSSEVLRGALAKAPTWRLELLSIELQGSAGHLPPIDIKRWAADQRRQLAQTPPPRLPRYPGSAYGR